MRLRRSDKRRKSILWTKKKQLRQSDWVSDRPRPRWRKSQPRKLKTFFQTSRKVICNENKGVQARVSSVRHVFVDVCNDCVNGRKETVPLIHVLLFVILSLNNGFHSERGMLLAKMEIYTSIRTFSRALSLYRCDIYVNRKRQSNLSVRICMQMHTYISTN